MNKINWENSPSTNTPLNADNLNRMQNYIEEAIDGIILFESGNGDNSGNITLNETIANFREVKVDYVIAVSDYTIYESKRVHIMNDKWITLSGIIAHSDILQVLDIARYLFSGTSFTRIHETRSRIGSGGTVNWDGNSTGIYITKVIGYR